jgi:DNA-binding MarR family transcriptional regulator
VNGYASSGEAAPARAADTVDSVDIDHPDPAEVAELMFCWIHRARRLVDARLAEQGLSLPRAKMLGALRGGACAQNRLAGTFDLAPRTITELVDGLERQGLVERIVDPSDRRVRQVHLTEAGREAHGRAWSARTEILTELFGSLDEDQLRQLAATVRQLVSDLDDL